MMNEAWQRSQYACDVDGIVSIDPVFIQKMVEINGNVTLEDGTVLTGKNTAEYMLNTIYKEVPVSLQDTYFEYIASTIMNNAFSNMDITKMMKVAQSIGELTRNRHFYAYTFHDDEANISKVPDSPRALQTAKPIRKWAFTSTNRIRRSWMVYRP